MSGKGIHIIVRAALPEGGRRKGNIEMYEDGRFFALTGRILSDLPTTVETRQDEVSALHAEVLQRGNQHGRLDTKFAPVRAPRSL